MHLSPQTGFDSLPSPHFSAALTPPILPSFGSGRQLCLPCLAFAALWICFSYFITLSCHCLPPSSPHRCGLGSLEASQPFCLTQSWHSNICWICNFWNILILARFGSITLNQRGQRSQPVGVQGPRGCSSYTWRFVFNMADLYANLVHLNNKQCV